MAIASSSASKHRFAHNQQVRGVLVSLLPRVEALLGTRPSVEHVLGPCLGDVAAQLVLAIAYWLP